MNIFLAEGIFFIIIGIATLLPSKRAFEIDPKSGVINTKSASIPVDRIRLFTYRRMYNGCSIHAVSVDGATYLLAKISGGSMDAAVENMG